MIIFRLGGKKKKASDRPVSGMSHFREDPQGVAREASRTLYWARCQNRTTSARGRLGEMKREDAAESVFSPWKSIEHERYG